MKDFDFIQNLGRSGLLRNQNLAGARSQIKAEAFNLEKEHRIINPHKMELRTTNMADFKNFEVPPPAKPEEKPK